ncbi:MAG TPA: DUF202 domain-containing protein [Pseudonocardia sp.]
MTEPPLFDPGLQAERTGLAWRRTMLGLVAFALAIMRLLPTLGAWGLAAGGLVLTLSGVLWALAERRSRRLRQALPAAGQLPGGKLLLAVALTVAGTGGGGLLYLLITRPFRG